MPNLPDFMISILSIFLPMFSRRPSYNNLLTLFYAHVLCKGRRTVTELLKRINLKYVKNFAKYHAFFSKAQWSWLKGSQILFIKLVSLVPGEIIVSVDSTVERRKGPKIKGLGIQRDAVRSTRSRKVLVPGLNWLVFAIHLRLPWTNRLWALPFLSILMPPEQPLSTSCNKQDLTSAKKHKTLTKWTCQVVLLLRRWLGPDRKILIVADNAFAIYALANSCVDCKVGLISRMRLDARTFEFPLEKIGRGRKRLVGKRLPTFKAMLEDSNLVWENAEVNWYGAEQKNLEYLSGSCLWYGYGIRPVPIKWVLTRSPGNNATAVVIFTTDLNKSVKEIVENFVIRWQLEVTFEESRRHLGMETQRQWSDNAIDKMTPCILASYSIINLMILENITATGKDIPIQTSSWYKKSHVTFSDVLAYLRREILEKKDFSQIGANPDLWNSFLEEWVDQMTSA